MGAIVGCAFRVMNGLGAGSAEAFYENALALELDKAGLAVLHQQAIALYYDGIVVIEYLADLLEGASLLIQLKAVRAFDKTHMTQCIDYLTAPGCMCARCSNSVGHASTPSQ